MTLSFEEALALTLPRVAAWDYESAYHATGTLSVFSVADNGGKKLASTVVASEDRNQMIERVRQRGLRLGGTHLFTPYVWAIDEHGFALWDDKRQLASGTLTELDVGGVRILAENIVEVRTNIGERCHRGVVIVRRDGETFLVEDDWEGGMFDWYDQRELDDDFAWAYHLAQDVAFWLGVPHVDHWKVIRTRPPKLI